MTPRPGKYELRQAYRVHLDVGAKVLMCSSDNPKGTIWPSGACMRACAAVPPIHAALRLSGDVTRVTYLWCQRLPGYRRRVLYLDPAVREAAAVATDWLIENPGRPPVPIRDVLRVLKKAWRPLAKALVDDPAGEAALVIAAERQAAEMGEGFAEAAARLCASARKGPVRRGQAVTVAPRAARTAEAPSDDQLPLFARAGAVR